MNPADIEGERTYLLKYARLQLRNPALARGSRAGNPARGPRRRSAFQRQIDHTHLAHRHPQTQDHRPVPSQQPLAAPDDDRSEADVIDALFVADGHWQQRPASWGDPEQSFENQRFWAAFEECVRRLPERAARAFTMREVMELSTEEICQELDITPTNCWVMLHRARLLLRKCLETQWFGQTGQTTHPT